MCQMMISPGVLFIMIFGCVRGVKGKKIAQTEKLKLHPSHVVSHEECSIMIVIFGTLV